MAAPKHQYEKRTDAIFTDEHGREWDTTIDTNPKSMGVVGIPVPSGWTAPWVPEYKYFIYDVKRRTIRFNYEACIEDRTRANERWEEDLRSEARRLYRDQAASAIADPPLELLDAIGKRPLPPEVPMAAQAGDPWLLGFSSVKPDKAAAFFPEKRPNTTASNYAGKRVNPFALEEEYDPDATGGKTVPNKPRGGKKKED